MEFLLISNLIAPLVDHKFPEDYSTFMIVDCFNVSFFWLLLLFNFASINCINGRWLYSTSTNLDCSILDKLKK